MGRLEGKVALVTGASRGIGQAIAERFAAEGARVACAARAREEFVFQQIHNIQADVPPENILAMFAAINA